MFYFGGFWRVYVCARMWLYVIFCPFVRIVLLVCWFVLFDVFWGFLRCMSQTILFIFLSSQYVMFELREIFITGLFSHVLILYFWPLYDPIRFTVQTNIFFITIKPGASCSQSKGLCHWACNATIHGARLCTIYLFCLGLLLFL